MFLSRIESDPAIGVGYPAILNGQAANGPGAEFVLTLRPFEGLSLGANVSWNDLKVNGDVLNGTTVVAKDGERLGFSPKYTLGGFADYSFPIGGGLKGTASFSANYKSIQNARSLNQVVTPSDAVFLSRLSFAIEDPDRWTATLVADNLNNFKGSPSASTIDEWRARPPENNRTPAA